jgi:hypothetical protein
MCARSLARRSKFTTNSELLVIVALMLASLCPLLAPLAACEGLWDCIPNKDTVMTAPHHFVRQLIGMLGSFEAHLERALLEARPTKIAMTMYRLADTKEGTAPRVQPLRQCIGWQTLQRVRHRVCSRYDNVSAGKHYRGYGTACAAATTMYRLADTTEGTAPRMQPLGTPPMHEEGMQ